MHDKLETLAFDGIGCGWGAPEKIRPLAPNSTQLTHFVALENRR